MKAVVYKKSVGLVLSDAEKPVPKDDEVLIRIHAVSVNAADYRSMRMGIIPKSGIFGTDVAGRVEAAGKNVRRFRPGDAVAGDLSFCGFGGFAEYVAAPERFLIPKPEGVSFEDAAAVPMAGVTALQALRNKGGIEPGQKVLIYGAGGGVGTFAVQLAKFFGAEVTAVCGPGNVKQALILGAKRAVDYLTESPLDTGDRYDIILAINGSNPLSAYRRALNPKGVCVLVGGGLSQVYKSIVLGPFLSTGGKKVCTLAAKQSLADLEFLMELVRSGKIKPVIDRRYTLPDTPEAVRYMSRGHATGKVIISVIDGGLV